TTEEMLDLYVRPKDELIDRRARFVVQEITRLEQACEDLKQGNIAALGRKMIETHDGLSTMYGVSCVELDWLVEALRNNEAVLGCRMMGGGFGGCTINLVREAAIEQLIATIQPAYEAATGLQLSWYVATIEDGTEIISNPNKN
ncbi:MAG TPA: hypothetical protein PK076_13875, partial [Saprospiraceae bacterium]|nr:hypothetical protein [Saprospiraceae bacterium]